MSDVRDSSAEDAVSRGVERALRSVLADQHLVESFWEKGYAELTKHAGNNASQWVGRRILVSIIGALTVAGIVWLVKTGNLK
jgi:hypothetical protein